MLSVRQVTGRGEPTKACGGMSNVVGPFPGTEAEAYRLQTAFEHNCTCPKPPVEGQPCPAHALLKDARVLGHLIFVYRKIELFRYEEWDLEVTE